MILALELATSSGWVHGRPADCAQLEEDRGRSLWTRAKDPDLDRFCTAIAAAIGELSAESPDTARALAAVDAADRHRPGQAVAMAVRAVILATTGKTDEARTMFERAREQDPRALDEPFVALAYARLRAGLGDLVGAGDIYRALLVRASLPPRDADAMRFEAGMVLMAAGPSGLPQATAILREGRERATVRYADAFELALALALDRGERGDAASGGTATTRTLNPTVEKSLQALGLAYESHALRATAQAREPKAARESYRRFLAERGDKSAWAEHARSRMAAEPRKAEPRR